MIAPFSYMGYILDQDCIQMMEIEETRAYEAELGILEPSY